jgi:hypothetical protein
MEIHGGGSVFYRRKNLYFHHYLRVQNGLRVNTVFYPTDTRTFFCLLKRAGVWWYQIKLTACIMNVRSFPSLHPAQFYLCGYIVVKTYTVEFHLSGLIGAKSHPDKQKIQIIGFFFKNRLRWQLEVGKMSTNGCVRLHFYLHIYKSLIHNSWYELDNRRKI